LLWEGGDLPGGLDALPVQRFEKLLCAIGGLIEFRHQVPQLFQI